MELEENSNLLPSLTTGTDTNNGNPPCNSGNVVSIDTFETFTSSTILLSNNSTLNILLQFNGMDAGDEGIYLDNIIITETVGSPIIADQLVFTSIPTNADNVIPFTLEVCATNGTSTQTTYTDSIYLSQILGDSSTITQTQTINGCATFTIIPNYSGDTLSFYTSSGTLTNDSTGNIIVNTPPNTNGALLVNEFSNGVSGTKEYIELLVLGDPSNPLDNVDLTGWIIDDNNGDFKAGTGSGIKPGHIRLTSSLNSVPPGSIILIYNIEDKNTSITQLDDPLDLINPDGVYIIPANDTTTLESTTLGGTPNSTISTYAGNTYIKPDSSTWEDRISYRNGGDAAIVVSPDFVLFHGLSYGDNDSIVTNGVFTDSLSGTGKVYSFTCSAMYDPNAYTTSDASSSTQTPGIKNNDNNGDLINAIKDGTVSYSDLISSTSNINCSTILPVELLSFEAKSVNNKFIQLDWVTVTEINNNRFEVQRSIDGVDFEYIGWVDGNNNSIQIQEYRYDDYFVDNGITYYYRLKQIDNDGQFELTTIVSSSIGSNSIKGTEYYTVVGEKLNIKPTQGLYFECIIDVNNNKTYSLKLNNQKIWLCGKLSLFYVNNN